MQWLDRFNGKCEVFLGRKPSVREQLVHMVKWGFDYLFFGCSFTDYFGLGFYRLKAKEKKTYHTLRFANKFDRTLDTRESITRHNSKIFEYRHLKKYFNRDQLVSTECTYEEFAAFTEKHPVFFFKPDTSDCGKGIEKFTVTDQNCREVFDQVRQTCAVLDEPVVQHPELERLCPSSVNTIRIVSARVDGKVHVIGAALRMSDGKHIVDNYSQGGMAAAIDLKTGRIIGGAMNYANREFDAHPFSQVPFRGFQIPLWDKVLELVEQAGMEYTLNFVGWDIAIRENDCVLIEANPRPMVRVYQIAGNGGKRAEFRRLYRLWKETDGKKR